MKALTGIWHFAPSCCRLWFLRKGKLFRLPYCFHENRRYLVSPELVEGWFDKPVPRIPKGSPRTVSGLLLFIVRGAGGNRFRVVCRSVCPIWQ